MFNIFRSNNTAKDIIDSMPKFAWKFGPSFYIDEKEYTIGELVEYVKSLIKENKDLNDILKSIEEDGTEEHNEAVKLRQENAQLQMEIEGWKAGTKGWKELYNEKADAVDELVKEVKNLRHLKEENVRLMERVNEIDSDMNKEYQAEICTLKNDIAVLKNRNLEILKMYNGMVTQGGLKYMEAKLQIVQNNYTKCAKERDEFKHQLNAANKEIVQLKSKVRDYQDKYAKSFSHNDMDKLQKEIDQLKRWKKEQLTVQSWWDKVDSYVRDHDDAPLGGIVANTCLNFLKERDEYKKSFESMQKAYEQEARSADRVLEEKIKLSKEIEKLHKEVIEEDSKKRIDSLSLTIDRKNFEIDGLKAEIKKLKEDIVDYVIKKDDEVSELKRSENYYVCNHCGYKVAHNTNQWSGCACCKDGLMIEKEVQETVDTLKNMKTQGFEDYDPSDFEEPQKQTYFQPAHDDAYYQDAYAQKSTEYPVHWGGASNLVQKAQESTKDVKVDLEKPLDKQCDSEDSVIDWMADEGIPNDEEEWKCPCNVCKEGKTSWEEAASDLALKVTKLEKKVEELSLIKLQEHSNDGAHYAHFKKHGKWPWHWNPVDSPKEYDNL